LRLLGCTIWMVFKVRHWQSIIKFNRTPGQWDTGTECDCNGRFVATGYTQVHNCPSHFSTYHRITIYDGFRRPSNFMLSESSIRDRFHLYRHLSVWIIPLVWIVMSDRLSTTDGEESHHTYDERCLPRFYLFVNKSVDLASQTVWMLRRCLQMKYYAYASFSAWISERWSCWMTRRSQGRYDIRQSSNGCNRNSIVGQYARILLLFIEKILRSIQAVCYRHRR
jgi:hypothetical protein